MDIVIVDNGSRHLKALRGMCERYGRVGVVSPLELHDLRADVVVLSGSHLHGVAGDPRFYAAERRFVQGYDGPVIGICAGMQLIASAFGETLRDLPRYAKGKRVIRLHDSSLRFALGGEPTARVAEQHGWGLPHVHAPLMGLAYSDSGVEVIRHETRPIIGMQFHPEVKSPDGETIFMWALVKLGLVAAGKEA